MLYRNPVIMGILNITTDSFSDGGNFLSLDRAIAQAKWLKENGAHIIDIGGESTAPRRVSISADEECARVLPIIKAIHEQNLGRISIDTKKSAVAQEALLCGAEWINDQSAGLFDKNMPKIYPQAQKVVLMHHVKDFRGVDEGEKVSYQNPISQIMLFFTQRIEALVSYGIDENKLIIDPGIGFGKGLSDTLLIIKNLDKLKALKKDILIGVSRKSFIGKIIGEDIPHKRDYANMILEGELIKNGADIIRTHNVKALKDMLRVWEELELLKLRN